MRLVARPAGGPLIAGLLLLVACGGRLPAATATGAAENVATATGAPTGGATAHPAATSPPTSTARPAVTPSPLPSATPTIAPTATLAGCLEDTGAVAMPPGPLRIVYELDGQMWEWREESGLAEPLPDEPPVAAVPAAQGGGGLSADGRFLLEARQPAEGKYEIWVSAADGSDPRQLATVSADEIFERYPNATAVGLNYGWIGESPLVSYYLSPAFDALGDVPIQSVQAVDAEDGRSWVLLPAEMAWSYDFSPDGQQLYALSEAAFQVINVMDGGVLHEVPLEVVVPWDQGIGYTPDGSRILLFTEAGIALVNPADGALSEIPFAYAPVGAGHYSILPSIHWLPDNSRFYIATTSDDVWNDLQAEFTVWLVDTAGGSAEALSTFTGFYPSIDFSADWRRVAYWVQSRDNVRPLYVADVVSGQRFLYDSLPLLEFIDWSPDGQHFLYRAADSAQPILGHTCAPPQPLPGVNILLNGDIQWVDGQRLLVLGAPQDGARPLRLVSLDGSGVTIAELAGESPVYRYYFEE